MIARLVDFRIWRLAVPLGRVIGDNNCSYDTIGVVALELRLGDGRSGWGYGESCWKGTFTRPAWYIRPMASQAEMDAALRRDWWPLLEGRDPRADEIAAARRSGKSEYGYLDAAVRMALWDLRAQAEGVSVAELIAREARTGAPRERVRAYGSILDYPVSEADATALARWFVAQGFRTIKVKVGAPEVERDIARLRVVREAVGPEVELTADANEIWTVDVALERLAAYAAAGINLGYIEDPLPHDDFDGMERLAREAPLPVVGHDYVHTVEQVRELLERGCVRRLRVGKDIDFTMACARLAEQHGVPLIFGNSLFESSVHSSVALPHVERIEFSALGWNTLLREPVRFAEGHAIAPVGPGHGLDPNPAMLEAWSRPEEAA